MASHWSNACEKMKWKMIEWVSENRILFMKYDHLARLISQGCDGILNIWFAFATTYYSCVLRKFVHFLCPQIWWIGVLSCHICHRKSRHTQLTLHILSLDFALNVFIVYAHEFERTHSAQIRCLLVRRMVKVHIQPLKYFRSYANNSISIFVYNAVLRLTTSSTSWQQEFFVEHVCVCGSCVCCLFRVGCCLNADNNLMAYDILNLYAHITSYSNILFTYMRSVSCAHKNSWICASDALRISNVCSVFWSWIFGRLCQSPFRYCWLNYVLLLLFSLNMIVAILCAHACESKYNSKLCDADICWISAIYQRSDKQMFDAKNVQSYVRCRCFPYEIDHLWIFMVI